ncbi:MAG: hypothetical protein JO053_00045 [Acidobacteria bacterium]|nr:hypothetical protein [Acidobacteriota bacterium]
MVTSYAGLSALCLLLLFASVPAQTTPSCTVDPKTDRATVKAAELCLQPMIGYIDYRIDQMSSRYYYQAGSDTMKAVFKSRGLSAGYSDPWGKWMGLTWSQSVEKFYTYHRTALEESLKTIRIQGYATKKDLDYLSDGMRRWRDVEAEFPEYFEYHLERSADEEAIYEQLDKYLKDYDVEYHRLFYMNPYPSDRVDALSRQRDKIQAQYNAQAKVIVSELALAAERIGERAGIRLFTPITEGAVTEEIT